MTARRLSPLFLTLLISSVAFAGPKFGVKLGEVNFADWQNGLVLKLPECKGSKNVPIQEMKFEVVERRVHVDRVKLILHTGEQLDIKVNKDIKSGVEQKWVPIGEKPGCISLIRLIEDEKATHIPAPQDVVLSVWGR